MGRKRDGDGATWAGPNEDDTWTGDRAESEGDGVGRSVLGHPDRYGTARMVGRGALGRVVKVFDRRLARDVARKELLQQTSRHRQRFLREARITARLEHPNIVPVHDAGETAAGRLFYTMRYIRGRSLGEAIQASPDMETRLGLLDHMVDVCQAMAYAHSQGVVHRDLKPDNFMLGAFGETWVVDWGLARFIDHSGGSAAGVGSEPELDAPEITRDGAVVGTPLYMSPEQAAGRPVDPRSEVWSLGAVLFHLVVGRPPFEGQSARAVLDAVLVQPVPRVESLAPGCPRELAAIIERAMSRSRTQRYATVAALAEDLRGFLQGRWVSAYSYGWSERLMRLVVHNRALVGLSAVAVAALVSIGVAGDVRVRAEREEVRVNLSQSLAERALDAATNDDLIQARLLAVRSLAYGESPSSRGVLAQVSAAWSPLLTEQWAWDGGCRKIALVESGHALACVNPSHASWLDEGIPRWRLPGDWQDVAVSPDRTEVALVSTDEVRVVSAADGKTLRSHPAGEFPFDSVAWSEEGLAWSGRSGFVAVENGPSWRVDCNRHTPSLSWAEDGRLAVACLDAHHFLVDPAAPEDALLGFSGGASYSVSVHPDMTEWMGGASLGRLHLWSLPGGELLKRFEGDGSFVYTSGWSPDGKLIAGGTDGGTVLVWDARYGDLVARIPAEGEPVATFAFTDDGRTLVTAGGKDIRCWELPVLERHVIEPQFGQGEGVANAWVDEEHGLAWVRDGAGRILRWNLATGTSLGKVRLEDCDEALSLSGTPMGPVVTCRNAQTVLLDRLTAEPLATDASHIAIADGLYMGGLLVGVSRLPGMLLVDVPSLEVREQIALPGDEEPNEVFAGPDGLAWVTSRKARIWVVDTQRRQVVRTFEAPEYAPSLAVTPDGKRLVMGTRGGDILVLDALDGLLLERLEGHEHLVSHVEFRPDGDLLSASWDNTLRVWDVSTGTALAVLQGHTSRVSGLAQYADDNVLSWSWDHTGRIWSLADLHRDPLSLAAEAERLTGMKVEP